MAVGPVLRSPNLVTSATSPSSPEVRRTPGISCEARAPRGWLSTFRPNRGTDRALPPQPSSNRASSASSPCSTAAHAPLSSVASSPCSGQILRSFLLTRAGRRHPRGRGAALTTAPDEPGKAATPPRTKVDRWRRLRTRSPRQNEVGRGARTHRNSAALNGTNCHPGTAFVEPRPELGGVAAAPFRPSGWRRVHARETRSVLLLTRSVEHRG